MKKFLMKIINTKIIVPLVFSIVFLFLYNKIDNTSYYYLFGCSTAISCLLASLNPYVWELPCQIKFINLTVLLYPILFFIPIINILYALIWLYFLLLAGANDRPRSSSSSTDTEIARHNYIMEREAKKQTKLMEDQIKNAQYEYQQSLSSYGVVKPQLPPGGYKLCRIFVINHDGTSATFHHIGLEHEARKMFEFDPRFKQVQVSVDSLDEYGHYGFI